MDQKAYLAVAAMLNAFPQGNGNPDLMMGTYEAVLRDVTSQAVIEAAQRFTAGDVAGQNRTFAPSVAEFTQEARRVAEIKAAIARPRIAFVPKQSELAPFLVSQEKARAKYAGWTVFKDDVGYDQFRAMSRAREIPVGATWVAALGTVYVPPASA